MSNELTYNGKVYGADEGGDQIISANGYICDSLPAVELAVDTLRATVRDYDNQLRVITYKGLPVVTSEGKLLVSTRSGTTIDKSQIYGSEVLYHHDGDLVGKFRLEEIKRTGKYEYSISCVSSVGLLLTSYHYGGIYNGQSAAEVIADIIGGVIPYTLDETLGAVPVYGLLRKHSRRDNLRDILFAIGGQVRKDTAGEVHIVPMEEGVPYDITADEFYMGGSVTGRKPATGVSVTEHSFMALPSDSIVTLFDGASTAEEMVTPKGEMVVGVLVDFTEPMHDLSIKNAVILESGANYAVISGSPAAVLTGKQYTHTTRIVSRQVTAEGSPNVVSSSACELVNLLNSELVADRLMAYYGSAKTIEADIVVADQKPGDAVTFTDPFGDPTTGYIADMELTMSAILKARATLVAGYIPTASGNYYSHVMVITETQDITIPAAAKGKGLLTLCGGGDGGKMGQAGTAGGRGTTSSFGAGGEGGQPGDPGAGGKVFVATIPLEAGEVIHVEIGPGGAGQTASHPAQAGGATTFGAFSSEDGFSSPNGFASLLTDEVFGLPGEAGIPGGKGGGSNGEGESIDFDGVTYTPGAKAEDVTLGAYVAGGGYGGGPAAGVNGYSGGKGSIEEQSNGYFVTGGSGGKGATPIKAKDGSAPGQGGGGGHGGGGGGGSGAAKAATSSLAWNTAGGDPGAAGEAGSGAPGIALLYY